MRRQKLLIAFLVVVSFWAFSSRNAENAFAQDGLITYSILQPEESQVVYPISQETYEISVEPEPVISSPPEESRSTDISESVAVSSPPATSMVNEPYVDRQWALDKMEISALWQLTTGSQDVIVAVLDTGIDDSHKDINGKVIADINFSGSPTVNDLHGHGTHIAGIIAAKDNNFGIIGIAPDCSILNVKVADDTGRCKSLDLAEGIIWAADNGADVINISIEMTQSSSALDHAISYAWQKGSLIIAAAGNDGSESPVYPANSKNCVAVAALNQDNEMVTLSNYGDWVDMVAPGCEIYSTLPDNEYGYKSGTSFACAYVSGVAALLFDIVTDTNDNGRINDEVKAIIETGCQELDISGVGMGLIDAAIITGQLSNAS